MCRGLGDKTVCPCRAWYMSYVTKRKPVPGATVGFPVKSLLSFWFHLYSHQQPKQTFQNATCLVGHGGDKKSTTLTKTKQKLLLQLIEVSGCFVFLLHSWLRPKVDICSSPHHPGLALCLIWWLRHRRRDRSREPGHLSTIGHVCTH